jgi:3-oxoadipyl-CoA thiolase
MPEALLLDAVRTPIGRYGGALAGVRPDDLAAHVLAAAVQRTRLDPHAVDDVLLGCANGAGEDNRNVARMAALVAGLPVEVPGVTLNRLCASGLDAAIQASRAVLAGDGDLFLAGGVESMSRAPLVMRKPERAFARGTQELADSTIGWRFVNPRLAARHAPESMGETAENVAERYDVSRADQDDYACESHRRAVAAREAGRLADEVVGVETRVRRAAVTVEHDEGVRAGTTIAALAALPPAFREGGTVTAGNSSQISDGAACLVLGSEQAAARLGIDPLARVVSVGVFGVDPAYMGIGPVPAVRKALARAGLAVGDLDLVELNEAFASQTLACMRELGLSHERTNVNGGAIALGHPLGCSGARILGTLCHELRRRGGRYGLAAMCVGVGQGVAVIVENPAA